jgi:Sec-independent protein translocase protein TatA
MGIVVLLYAGKRLRRMGDEIDAMVQEMRDEVARDREFRP